MHTLILIKLAFQTKNIFSKIKMSQKEKNIHIMSPFFLTFLYKNEYTTQIILISAVRVRESVSEKCSESERKCEG